ncbi:MAG: O-antigen ligase family protein [Bryobacteraceae bacterium]
MQFVVLLVASLVPLLITPGLLLRFDITPKIAVLLFGVSALLLFCKQNVRNVRKLLSARTGRWLAGLLAAQWCAAAFSTALSRNPALSLNGSSWRREGLLTGTALILFTLVAAGWLVGNRKNARTLLRWASASGAAAAVYGIAQYFGFDPLLPARAYQAGEGAFTIVRPPSTLGHADYFAAWLVAVFFCAIALAQLEQTKRNQMLAGAAAALSATAIVLSGTRSALLGLAAGGIALLALLRPRIDVRTGAAAAVAAVCFAVLFISPAGQKLRARVHWSVEDARGGARLLLWEDSLRMSGHRLLAGFGPETFATEFPRFESLDLARKYPDFYHESAHSVFLDALTERGILGLLALVGLFGVGFYAHAKSRSNYTDALACGLLGTLVCHGFSVLIAPTALYFYLLLALLATAAPLQEPETEDVRELPRGFVIGLSAVMALVLATYGVRLVVADAALAAAGRRIESGNASDAAAAYAAAIRWEPPGSGADLDYSRSMAALANRTPIFATRVEARTQALRAAARAARTAEDRQNAWYHLATLLAGEGDAAGAEHSLRNAIAWAPNWFKPHWTLAQLLELTGRRDEALAEAAEAVARDGGHNPEVRETLRKIQQIPPAAR